MSVLVQAPPEINPLQDPLRFDRRVPPCAIVIFGASGDLSKRKLLPSLYRLFYERRISPNFAVIGSSRTPMSDDAFRTRMKESVSKFLEDAPFDEDVWNSFAQCLFYVAGDLSNPASYDDIRNKLDEVEKTHQTAGNALFYLSTQPSFYAEAILQLGEHGLTKGNGWRRVIIEKPFGYDLTSARKLNQEIHKVFDESEIYRIDHYLGKETVQNILAFRFGNGIFEPLWNRRYVDHIQITAAESIGVEGRGGYYQEAGALRDMIQNHLSQVMATVMMEPPTVFDATNVRDERAKLLRAVRVMKPEDVPKYAVAGQYGPALVGGQEMLGFRQEPSVDPDAQTDTYAAVTFFVDNWRWAGVPIYIRTGKRMPKRVTDIAIQFHAPPLGLVHARKRRLVREKFARTSWCFAFSRKRASRCGSSRRVPAAACASVRFRWISITVRVLASARPRPMKRCWSMPWRAIRRFTPVRTWWMRAGKSCSRFSISGRRPNSISRITRLALGARERPIKCLRAKDMSGGFHE